MPGSKPGERRGGRQKGTPNKATRDIRELAQKHGPAAIQKAVSLMENAESEDTQLRAAMFLAERGYGKAKEYKDVNLSGGIKIGWENKIGWEK